MPLDTLRSLGAKLFLNQHFSHLGEVEEVSIDPRSGQATLVVALKGERERLHVKVDYHVMPDALVLENFHCEREWIESALNRFLSGKRLGLNSLLVQTLVKQFL